MAIEYGLGFWEIHEFLKSAGELGWELRSSMHFANTTIPRAIGGKGELRKAEDASEVMLLVFKRPASEKKKGTPGFLTYMENEVKKLER